MKNKSGLHLLSSIIPQDAHWKIKILNRWPQIAGGFAKHVSIKTIEETSLTLEATHPAWAQEIRGCLDDLLAAIHRVSGNTNITKILVLGSKKHKPSQGKDSGKTRIVQRTLFEAPSLELTQAERDALSTVRHKKLATSMAEFYLQCKQRAGKSRTTCDQGACNNDSCNHSTAHRLGQPSERKHP